MSEKERLESERLQVLSELEDWLEGPMLVLGFVWLALLVVEFAFGGGLLVELFSLAIWGVFVLDFLLRLALAPRRGRYLRRNWLTAISLLVPALRLLRVARLARLLQLSRTTRGLRLVRVVTSLNRGMKALGATMRRRGFGYVLALSLLVTFSGAAGMYSFESQLPGGEGFASYGEALWWTAMLLTSLGSEFWPQTAEGRILCLILAIYGFAVFGYITASFASFFVGRDAAAPDSETPGLADLAALREEIAALRQELLRRPDAPLPDPASRPPHG